MITASDSPGQCAINSHNQFPQSLLHPAISSHTHLAISQSVPTFTWPSCNQFPHSPGHLTISPHTYLAILQSVPTLTWPSCNHLQLSPTSQQGHLANTKRHLFQSVTTLSYLTYNAQKTTNFHASYENCSCVTVGISLIFAMAQVRLPVITTVYVTSLEWHTPHQYHCVSAMSHAV